MKTLIAALTLMLIATPALARKSCDELKSEIEAKIKAKGVKEFTLDIAGKDEQKEGSVVGTCDGGAKKIVYKRG
ncbi:MAG: DUF1161 domain-containing protein [Betaproteobacteria bacterium]|nr:DUF1161 domain-containing protein [Betaproteobacteria bacterium]